MILLKIPKNKNFNILLSDIQPFHIEITWAEYDSKGERYEWRDHHQ